LGSVRDRGGSWKVSEKEYGGGQYHRRSMEVDSIIEGVWRWTVSEKEYGGGQYHRRSMEVDSIIEGVWRWTVS
jgi:hypothetical protein